MWDEINYLFPNLNGCNPVQRPKHNLNTNLARAQHPFQLPNRFKNLPRARHPVQNFKTIGLMRNKLRSNFARLRGIWVSMRLGRIPILQYAPVFLALGMMHFFYINQCIFITGFFTGVRWWCCCVSLKLHITKELSRTYNAVTVHRRWECYIRPKYVTDPDSKVHGANMGPIWGR